MSRGRAKFVQSLQIMLSPKEAQYIRRYADAAGMTRSGYGRQIIRTHLETKILMEGGDAKRTDRRRAGTDAQGG